MGQDYATRPRGEQIQSGELKIVIFGLTSEGSDDLAGAAVCDAFSCEMGVSHLSAAQLSRTA